MIYSFSWPQHPMDKRMIASSATEQELYVQPAVLLCKHDIYCQKVSTARRKWTHENWRPLQCSSCPEPAVRSPKGLLRYQLLFPLCSHTLCWLAVVWVQLSPYSWLRVPCSARSATCTWCRRAASHLLASCSRMQKGSWARYSHPQRTGPGWICIFSIGTTCSTFVLLPVQKQSHFTLLVLSSVCVSEHSISPYSQGPQNVYLLILSDLWIYHPLSSLFSLPPSISEGCHSQESRSPLLLHPQIDLHY